MGSLVDIVGRVLLVVHVDDRITFSNHHQNILGVDDIMKIDDHILESPPKHLRWV